MMSYKDRSYYKFIQEHCPQTLVEVCRLRMSYKNIIQQVEQRVLESLSGMCNVSAYIVTKFARTCNGIKVCLQRNIRKKDNALDAPIVNIKVSFDSVSAAVAISMNIIDDIYKSKQDNFAKGTDSKGMDIAQYSSRNFNLSASVCILVCLEKHIVIEEGANSMVFVNYVFHQNTDDYVHRKYLMINNNAAIICTLPFGYLKPITDTNSCHEKDNSDLSESFPTHQDHLDLKPAEKIQEENSSKRTKRKKPKLFLDKILMVLIFLLTIGHVNAAPRNEDAMMFSKDLLESKYCNMDNLYSLKELCHTNGNDLQLLTDSCDFSDLCDEDEKPYCINTNEFGAFVCLKKNLSCQKGRYYKAGIDINSPRKILIQEDKCPGRTYQSYESDCIHACVDEHRDLKDIPEKYLVYSVGNTTNPTQVYCNFQLGYFNGAGNFLLDYDKEELHEPFFCDYVGDYNPCKEWQQPLPNGTCVDKCDIWFARIAPDFVCTPTRTNIYPTKEPLPSRPTATKASLTTTYLYPNTQTVPKTRKTTDNKDRQMNDDDNQNSEFPLWAIVLISVVVVLVVIVLVSVILCFVLTKPRVTVYKNINEIENQNTVVNAKNVNMPGSMGPFLPPQENNTDDPDRDDQDYARQRHSSYIFIVDSL